MAKQNRNTVVDFERLRKKRQRLATAKRLLMLAGIALLVCLVMLVNHFLVEENFTARISDWVSGFGGSGYPVALPGGVIRSVSSVGNNLALLNDTNLYLYNGRGKQVGNFRQMSEQTVLLTSDDRMLTYDQGAKKYELHSRSKTLHSVTDLDYGIITAALNDRGDYAIVSSSKQSMCEVNVYNRHNENIYTYYYANNVVSAAAVSPRGIAMTVGWVNTQGGVLVSGLEFFQLSMEKPSATLELYDQLVLRITYLNNDRIAVLTDQAYLIIGVDGQIQHQYAFGGRQLLAVENNGQQTLLLLEDAETRQRDLVLLDANLEEQAVQTTEEKIADIALSSRRIYVLWEDAIRTYTLKFALDEEEPVQYVSEIQLVGSKLYYFDREEIRVFGQAAQTPAVDTAVSLPESSAGDAGSLLPGRSMAESSALPEEASVSSADEALPGQAGASVAETLPSAGEEAA